MFDLGMVNPVLALSRGALHLRFSKLEKAARPSISQNSISIEKVGN